MSLHLIDYKAIFFHTQRTGGRWVGKAMANAGIKMYTEHNRGGNKNSFHELEDSLKDEFLFTFIRHPVAWYKSYWAVRMDSGWRPDWIDAKYKADNLEQFFRYIIAGKIPYISQHFFHYIGKPKKMNFVGLNENIVNDLIKVLTILNVNFDKKPIIQTERVNASTDRHQPCSKELIDKIIDLEDEIISQYYKDTPYENYVYEFMKG